MGHAQCRGKFDKKKEDRHGFAQRSGCIEDCQGRWLGRANEVPAGNEINYAYLLMLFIYFWKKDRANIGP